MSGTRARGMVRDRTSHAHAQTPTQTQTTPRVECRAPLPLSIPVSSPAELQPAAGDGNGIGFSPHASSCAGLRSSSASRSGSGYDTRHRTGSGSHSRSRSRSTRTKTLDALRTALRIPFLPLLVTLHLVFTLSSLVLRAYELLTAPEFDDDASEGAVTGAGAAAGAGAGGAGIAPSAAATATAAACPAVPPPRHVGMVLLPPPGQSASESGPRTGKGKGTAEGRRREEMVRRVAETVANLVEMAGEEGVREVSVYESSGLLDAAKSAILADVLHIPSELLVPSSGSSASASTSSLSPSSSRNVSPSPRRPARGKRRVSESLASSQMSDSTLIGDDSGSDVMSFTLHISPRFALMRGTGPAQATLTVHLLPASASDVVERVAHDLKQEGVAPHDITQDVIGKRVHEALHFSRDPDLLLVHPLQSPPIWRGWLPRPAPILGGYPFWTLRITEIYHHPPPLPLITTLAPLLHLARTSHLPFIRKLGRLGPPPVSARGELVDLYRGAGRIGLDEWEGAMRAWGAVEQRLGK